MARAVVVGSGPNGLAGAVALARAGLDVTVLEARDTVGGGSRTEELTLPGVLHDVCSAVHPFAAASPFLASLPLAEHGLEWCLPEVDLVHVLDGGRAGVMVRSLDETVAGLGEDGRAWRRTFGPIAGHFPALAGEILRPIQQRFPRHPLRLASFGLRGLLPATTLARRWRTDEARGLFAGAAAHAFHPLTAPTTSAIGLALIGSGHHVGWPVARGGSRAIGDALVSLLESLGGKVETGTTVTSLDDLPPADAVLLDLAPRGVLDVAGDALPPRVARAYRRYRYGPAAWKVDLAVEGGVPWTAEPARRAGTVHVGGTLEEIAAAERDVHRGRMPADPFLLVGQQYLADPSRSVGDVHPVWAYAHVPHGYDGDATEAVIDRIEHFAPGLRDRIVGRHVAGPAAIEAGNANFVGGDIATGAADPRQVLFRPRLAFDPYATGIPGVFICSAATPPGAGVHGMGGFHAARSALRHLRLG
ncbi:MAG: NAD(P)/FAD-dependent oxidoreductase [Acidimicrobiales bacterium]|nr:NAD(P)/FAD-dependent oxidoreductase [Acidimicrobiales bacterium]